MLTADCWAALKEAGVAVPDSSKGRKNEWCSEPGALTFYNLLGPKSSPAWKVYTDNMPK